MDGTIDRLLYVAISCGLWESILVWRVHIWRGCNVKGAPGWSPKRPRDRKSPGKWIIVVSSWERVYIIRQSCLSHRMYHAMLLNLPVCNSENIDVKLKKWHTLVCTLPQMTSFVSMLEFFLYIFYIFICFQSRLLCKAFHSCCLHWFGSIILEDDILTLPTMSLLFFDNEKTSLPDPTTSCSAAWSTHQLLHSNLSKKSNHT
jgi:hypothetical protein